MITISKHARSGFSLIEILVAIAIVIIMAAVIVPGLMTYRKNAKIDAARLEIKNLQTPIEMFNDHTGSYPETLQDLTRAPLNEELAKEWRGPYASAKQLKDPWGSPYQYSLTPGGEHEYMLYSYGPKKKSAPQTEWIDAWKIQ